MQAPTREPINQAKRELNRSLRGVINALSRHWAAEVFQTQVPKIHVPDYNKYVPAKQEMWLQKIKSKTTSNSYDCEKDFRADVEQLLINAQKYNGPDGGFYKTPDIIDRASAILATCDQLLPTRLKAMQEGTNITQRASARPPKVSGGMAQNKSNHNTTGSTKGFHLTVPRSQVQHLPHDLLLPNTEVSMLIEMKVGDELQRELKSLRVDPRGDVQVKVQQSLYDIWVKDQGEARWSVRQQDKEHILVLKLSGTSSACSSGTANQVAPSAKSSTQELMALDNPCVDVKPDPAQEEVSQASSRERSRSLQGPPNPVPMHSLPMTTEAAVQALPVDSFMPPAAAEHEQISEQELFAAMYEMLGGMAPVPPAATVEMLANSVAVPDVWPAPVTGLQLPIPQPSLPTHSGPAAAEGQATPYLPIPIPGTASYPSTAAAGQVPPQVETIDLSGMDEEAPSDDVQGLAAANESQQQLQHHHRQRPCASEPELPLKRPCLEGGSWAANTDQAPNLHGQTNAHALGSLQRGVAGFGSLAPAINAATLAGNDGQPAGKRQRLSPQAAHSCPTATLSHTPLAWMPAAAGGHAQQPHAEAAQHLQRLMEAAHQVRNLGKPPLRPTLSEPCTIHPTPSLPQPCCRPEPCCSDSVSTTQTTTQPSKSSVTHDKLDIYSSKVWHPSPPLHACHSEPTPHLHPSSTRHPSPPLQTHHSQPTISHLNSSGIRHPSPPLETHHSQPPITHHSSSGIRHPSPPLQTHPSQAPITHPDSSGIRHPSPPLQTHHSQAPITHPHASGIRHPSPPPRTFHNEPTSTHPQPSSIRHPSPPLQTNHSQATISHPNFSGIKHPSPTLRTCHSEPPINYYQPSSIQHPTPPLQTHHSHITHQHSSGIRHPSPPLRTCHSEPPITHPHPSGNRHPSPPCQIRPSTIFTAPAVNGTQMGCLAAAVSTATHRHSQAAITQQVMDDFFRQQLPPHQLVQPQQGSAAGQQAPEAAPQGPQAGTQAGLQGHQAGTHAVTQGPRAGTQAATLGATQGPQAGTQAATQGREAGMQVVTQGSQAGTQAALLGPQAGLQAGLQAGTQAGLQAGSQAGLQGPQAGLYQSPTVYSGFPLGQREAMRQAQEMGLQASQAGLRQHRGQQVFQQAPGMQQAGMSQPSLRPPQQQLSTQQPNKRQLPQGQQPQVLLQQAQRQQQAQQAARQHAQLQQLQLARKAQQPASAPLMQQQLADKIAMLRQNIGQNIENPIRQQVAPQATATGQQLARSASPQSTLQQQQQQLAISAWRNNLLSQPQQQQFSAAQMHMPLPVFNPVVAHLPASTMVPPALITAAPATLPVADSNTSLLQIAAPLAAAAPSGNPITSTTAPPAAHAAGAAGSMALPPAAVLANSWPAGTATSQPQPAVSAASLPQAAVPGAQLSTVVTQPPAAAHHQPSATTSQLPGCIPAQLPNAINPQAGTVFSAQSLCSPPTPPSTTPGSWPSLPACTVVDGLEAPQEFGEVGAFLAALDALDVAPGARLATLRCLASASWATVCVDYSCLRDAWKRRSVQDVIDILTDMAQQVDDSVTIVCDEATVLASEHRNAERRAREDSKWATSKDLPSGHDPRVLGTLMYSCADALGWDAKQKMAASRWLMALSKGNRQGLVVCLAFMRDAWRMCSRDGLEQAAQELQRLHELLKATAACKAEQ